MKIAQITAKGRDALRNDRCQGADLLVVELASRTGAVERGHLQELAVELLHHYGTPERAVAALKTGRVKLEKA
jgi:hypothetical protein